MTSYTWDDGNRLATLKNSSASGTVVNNTSYIRDRLGNITEQTDTGGTTSFVYDALYRLMSADYPGTANDVSYTYDKVGNRKTESRNTSLTIPAQTFIYDAKGRVTSINGNTFKYDPYDYRIQKFDSRGSQTYLLEGEHLEAIMSGTRWLATFMRGAVIDEVVNAYLYDAQGKSTNYSYHHDNLQSVLGLTGHEGTVLQSISYGPFGEKAITGSADNNNLHFTGREEDTDSGLYYYRARIYDPTIGRFITEDPKGFAAGVNFYAYVQNNPINANDPDGLFPRSSAIKYLANKARESAWKMEQKLVQVTGNGSRNWSPSELDLLAQGNKVPGYQGHHINSVAKNQGMAGDPANITFLTREEHFIRHGGNWQNQTRDELIDRTLGGKILGIGAAVVTGLATVLDGAAWAMDKLDYIDPVGVFTKVMGPRDAGTGSDIIPNLSVEVIGFDMPSNQTAAGGFVIYPNKTNTNMMRSVYSK